MQNDLSFSVGREGFQHLLDALLLLMQGVLATLLGIPVLLSGSSFKYFYSGLSTQALYVYMAVTVPG